MNKYSVSLCYTGYMYYEVQAEDEREALDKAREWDESNPLAELDSLEREPAYDVADKLEGVTA